MLGARSEQPSAGCSLCTGGRLTEGKSMPCLFLMEGALQAATHGGAVVLLDAVF